MTEPPEWMKEYYDGDVPTLEEDPDGPLYIESWDDESQ